MKMVGVLRTSLTDTKWYSEFTTQGILDYPNDELFDYARWLPDSFELDSLRHLDFEAPSFKVGNQHESLAAILRHTPAVTRLRVSVGHYGRHVVPIIRQSLPQLKHLHLPDARMENIASIVKFCPGIESCRLGEDNGKVCMKRLPEFSPNSKHVTIDRVLEGLLPLRLTLRDLDADWQLLYARTIHHLSLLSRFSALRSLRLVFVEWPPGDTDTLPEMLPPGIESLCFGGIDIEFHTIAIQVRDYILKGGLQRLKLFRYVIMDVWTEREQDELRTLIASVWDGTDVECRDEWPPWQRSF